MLNIVEPVPPTEPIPSNSRNSVYHFQYNSGIPGISSYQFLGIPGIPSDSGIEWSSCHPHHHNLAIASNSWTEFRELSRAGIGRNSVRFRNWVIIMLPSPSPSHPGYCIQFLNRIPGIGRSSVEFLLISESDGIRVRTNSGIPGIGRIDSEIRRNSGLTQSRNSRNWFLGRNWFRNVQHCGIGWLLLVRNKIFQNLRTSSLMLIFYALLNEVLDILFLSVFQFSDEADDEITN
jgi:hypothetical protein